MSICGEQGQNKENIDQFLDSLPVPENKKYYVFGTGNTAKLYQEGLKRISELVIEGYVDNFSPEGTVFAGKSVYKPADLSERENVCVLLCSSQPGVCREVGRQLDELEIEWYHIDEVIFGLHKQEIREVYNLLGDGSSRDLYLTLLKCRTKCIPPPKERVTFRQYYCLPAFSLPDEREVFVDCGAYTGDSVEQYICAHNGVFGRIIAFEPDKRNYKAMEERTQVLKKAWNISNGRISIFPFGVGDKEEGYFLESYEENNGLGSKVIVEKTQNSEECRIISIDNFISAQYSFLKADIESFEYRMLLGARQSIEKWKPKLAICIYHNAVDFYSIPLLLKSFCPDFNFAVMHHSFQLDDTVFYAWQKEKNE